MQGQAGGRPCRATHGYQQHASRSKTTMASAATMAGEFPTRASSGWSRDVCSRVVWGQTDAGERVGETFVFVPDVPLAVRDTRAYTRAHTAVSFTS